MKNTRTEERELHVAAKYNKCGDWSSGDLEQMREWFEKHPEARKILTDAEWLIGEIASIDPERGRCSLASLEKRVRVYKRRRISRIVLISIATSAAVILLCIGIFRYRDMVPFQPAMLAINTPVVKDSVPTLILGSGERMDMTEYAVNKKVVVWFGWRLGFLMTSRPFLTCIKFRGCLRVVWRYRTVRSCI